MCTARTLCRVLLATAFALALPSISHSQSWKPDRNVEIVVPTAAGAASAIRQDAGAARDFAHAPERRLQPGADAGERGVDVVAMGWTAIIAPPGLTPAQIASWEQTLGEATKSEEWRKYLAFNYWQNVYQSHAQASAHLKTQYEQTRAGLVDLGLAK